MEENEIGSAIVDSAVMIHRKTGPGLLESVYETILARELGLRGLGVRRQVAIAIRWDGIILRRGFRADLLVEGKVIVELKSVEQVLPAHRKQLQTYLKLSGIRLGYLLNFGSTLMKDGVIRCVNGL